MVDESKEPYVGTIGLITSDLTRFVEFTASVMALERPPGRIKYTWGRGCDLPTDLNTVTSHMEGAWLWILNDDHMMPPDILVKLLARNVDVVGPLYCTKSGFYQPCIFHEDAPLYFVPYQWDELHGKSGLLECDGIAGAGMLIRKRVLDKLTLPFWECGKLAMESGLGEDLYFSFKVRKAGFKVYCDLDVPIGHCTTHTVWPKQSPTGAWYPELVMPDWTTIRADQLHPPIIKTEVKA